MNVTTIGFDIAKGVIQIHGVDAAGIALGPGRQNHTDPASSLHAFYCFTIFF
jgi:hypothetical protein